MIDNSNSRLIELPDRKEITLCEAVTAFLYGKAYDLRQFNRERSDEATIKLQAAAKSNNLLEPYDSKQFDRDSDEAPIKEQATKLNDLLERLHRAAYAGRIRFRGVREGEDPVDEYRDIDSLYFYIKPFFNWQQDVIFRREDETSTVWHFVHLDREQFASLLRDMGAAAQQFRTGLPGRPPTSAHFLMPKAQRRLDAEDHQKTITAFSKELADWLKAKGAPAKPRSIENAIRPLWHAHQGGCTK
jgi:hypothetical protein